MKGLETPNTIADSAIRPLHLVAVGNSHLAAIMKGYRQFRASASDGMRMTFVPLNDAEFGPTLKDGKLNPAVTTAIGLASPDAVLSCVGGNEHNVLGLLNHLVPFDFVLADEPSLPLDEAKDIVPLAIVRGRLSSSLQRGMFAILSSLRESTQVEIFQLESPPPNPSIEFILKNPGPAFAERIQETGVAPAIFRYKLWRVLSSLVREFCESVHINFVPVPEISKDNQGMLKEECWGINATHGNERFGYFLLHSVAILLNGKIVET